MSGDYAWYSSTDDRTVSWQLGYMGSYTSPLKECYGVFCKTRSIGKDRLLVDHEIKDHEIKMRPCRCGCKDIETKKTTLGKYSVVSVVCPKCGLTGSDSLGFCGEVLAIDAWNKS